MGPASMPRPSRAATNPISAIWTEVLTLLM